MDFQFADDHDLNVEYVIVPGSRSKRDDIFEGYHDNNWEDLAYTLLEHRPTRDKKDTPAIIPVRFKEEEDCQLSKPKEGGNPTFRNDKNVDAVTLVVLDLDKRGSLEKAKNYFEGFENIVYSTYSYSKEAPYKFRMVLPLKEPVPSEEWRDIFELLKVGVDPDKKCGNLSRIYYMPSYPEGSDIKPVSIYSHGELISKEDIFELSNKFLAENTVEINEFSSRQFKLKSGSGDDNKYHHFIEGEIYKHERFFGELDNSYEGMLARENLDSSIKKYLTGDVEDQSRHYFALAVTSSEYELYGGKVDLDATVQFMYRASQEFSSPISAGNTGEELVEMFASAMIKNCPEVLDEKYEGSIFKLQEDIERSINTALASEDSGNWSFPISANNSGSLYDYDEIKARHLEALADYYSSGDLTRLAVNVFDVEAKAAKDNVELLKVGEVVYKAAVNYFDNSMNQNNQTLDQFITNNTNILSDIKDDLFHDEFGFDKESFDVYMDSVFKYGQMIAKGREWTIKPEIIQEQSLAIGK